MKINFKRWWLLAICVIVGPLNVPIEGAGLEWVDSFVRDEHNNQVIRVMVPKTNQGQITATLYQQLTGGTLSPMHGAENLKMRPDWGHVQWPILGLKFQGDSKMVKAKIEYPDGVIMKSKTFDLKKPTKGADSVGTLEWVNSLKVGVNDNWEIQLRDVPSRGHNSYSVTLYQQLEGDKWVKLQACTGFNKPSTWDTITLVIPGSKFQGDTKIIMAEVTYPDDVMLESKTFNLQQLVKTANVVGLIVGCVVGGVCLIALVVGCIWCKKQRQRRVPLQQPVMVMGQGECEQRTQQHVVVQGQNNGAQQVVPQNRYV